MATWEQILVGVLALLIVLFFGRGIKPMVERSKNAPKDWPGLLIPIALVVGFIVLMASTLG